MATMKIKTLVDLELSKMLRKEMEILREYEAMFDDMTAGEKDELREWLVNGNSVNSNPYLLYGENGCLMDFINASRTAEDMAANPEQYHYKDVADSAEERLNDIDEPF